ncbi:hypothetical protein FRC00_001263 [Tulasnella sp. 408]|nr:hypothetical protein FRC00_001263 [Tulasnella sp. 408]
MIVKLMMERPVSPSSAAENGTSILERRSHNELLPIHRLPPELLYVIIENVYTEVSYKLLFEIRSVCKHWMELVDSMPQLWAQIGLHLNANLVPIILKKSETQPLDILCRGTNMENEAFEEGVTMFLRHVGRFAGRWRSLHYEAPTNVQHERIIGLSLHNLGTLTVHISETAIDYIGVFDAPRLRNLDVRRFSLNWRSLSDLHSLQIDDCMPSPTIDQLYILLKSSPNLEVFKIARNRDSPTGHPTDLNDAHSARILLPRLRSLLVAQVPFLSHARLLDLVEAPNLHRFVVFQSVQYPSYDFTPMFESAGRFIGACRRSTINDDTSRLNIFGPHRVLAIVVGDRRVILKNDTWAQGSRLEGCPAGLSAVFRHFDCKSSEKIKVVRLSGFGGVQEMIGLAQVLNRHLHNVEELEIMSSAHETPSILGWLSSSPTEEMEAWLFPRLNSLHFDVPKGVACDGILEVVKARRNVEHVQAVRQLTIEGGKIRRETVEELETYLETLKMTGTEVA